MIVQVATTPSIAEFFRVWLRDRVDQGDEMRTRDH